MDESVKLATPPSPFHPGETAIHERLGIRAKIEPVGRTVIRGFMPDQHRAFFAQLPWLLAGAVDHEGQPWASMLSGAPGFAHSPEPTLLRIDTRPPAGDPLAVVEGAAIGLLGIELHTRRRNRMNGTIETLDENGMTVRVTQSFGNCPKYIQSRNFVAASTPGDASPGRRADRLDAAMAAQVGAADTFFIASVHRGDGSADGVDVSHRGGKPAFVHVDEDGRTLTFPDFVGNFLFNTLGNLLLEPRAGLLFPHFASGDLLHVAGEAEIIWEGAALRAFAGAQRLVRLRVRKAILRERAMPLRAAGAPEFSPVLAPTGAWPTEPAQARLSHHHGNEP